MPRPYSGMIELNSLWKWSPIELNRAYFGVASDTKGAQRETPNEFFEDFCF